MCFGGAKTPDPPPPPPPPVAPPPLIPAATQEGTDGDMAKSGKRKLQIPLSNTKGGSGLGIPT